MADCSDAVYMTRRHGSAVAHRKGNKGDQDHLGQAEEPMCMYLTTPKISMPNSLARSFSKRDIPVTQRSLLDSVVYIAVAYDSRTRVFKNPIIEEENDQVQMQEKKAKGKIPSYIYKKNNALHT